MHPLIFRHQSVSSESEPWRYGTCGQLLTFDIEKYVEIYPAITLTPVRRLMARLSLRLGGGLK